MSRGRPVGSRSPAVDVDILRVIELGPPNSTNTRYCVFVSMRMSGIATLDCIPTRTRDSRIRAG